MILVTGASGTLGREVVAALSAQGVAVRALSRHRKVAFPAGVEAVSGNLDRPATLTGPLEGVRAVFLLAGFADMPGVLAKISSAAVARVVLLSSGAVVGGEESNAITRYNLESEAAVRASGMPWTVLRPSGYMSNALRWLPQLQKGDVVRAPFAEVEVAAVDPADIAGVAALTLTAPGPAHEGVHYRLTGPDALRPADQVATLAEVLNRPLRFEPQPHDEARAQMSSAMPAAYVDAFFRYYADGTYDDSQIHNAVPRLLGRPARTFRQWAEAHVGAFKSSVVD